MLSQSNKEALAVAAYLASNFVLNFVTTITVIYLLIYGTIGRYIVLLYFLWIYIDRGTAEKGGRGSLWFRNLAWWYYHRAYFPVNLHTNGSLPPDKNYILAIFPHGIVCAGGYSVFATEVFNISKIFPGIRFYLATINANFLLPLFREIMHLAGVVSVSRKSMDWILDNPGGGRAMVVYVGGAAEAAYCGDENSVLVLKSRKGFCRMAIIHGSNLVPTFVFGEKDLYKTLTPKSNTLVYKIQQLIKKVTGVLPVIFYGSKESCYLLPHRVPLDVVVGKPIEVKKNPNPTNEEVEALHKRFCEDIVELYNQESSKFIKDPKSHLVIV